MIEVIRFIITAQLSHKTKDTQVNTLMFTWVIALKRIILVATQAACPTHIDAQAQGGAESRLLVVVHFVPQLG